MNAPPPTTISLTVGTAGHIDHGKTELIKLLTGCDTDRLPEEKARGMTIDLGFATCALPDGRRVGIVDVPGHEKFIHNMVAGAAGIDVVLLVVAADDGVMPQTIEHFHIVRLLGVKAGMVAVTKTDLVSEERVADVCGQAKELVAGSFLEKAPIVPISSKTGAGFEPFYEAFSATVSRTAERDASGPFRLHIERSFVLQGIGTIVSGIPRSGKIKLGDELELLPAGDHKRVRGIQVYGNTAEEGCAGECLALRLHDLHREDAGRGHVLASPGHFKPSRFVSARFQLLPMAGKPLQPRTGIRLHIGTSDIPGHLVLPDLEPMQPGAEAYVQLQLKQPVVAAPGDPFVVRILSPVRTIGGGYVVGTDETKIRRSRGDFESERAEKDRAFRDPAEALAYAVEHAGERPARIGELAREAVLDEDAAGEHMQQLVDSGRAVSLGVDRFSSPAAVESAQNEIVNRLSALHDESPLATGFPKRVVRSGLSADRLLLDRALQDLTEADKVRVTDTGMHLAGREPSLTEGQQALAEKIRKIYAETRFASPRPDELPERLGTPAPLIRPVLDHLVQTGDIVRIDARILLHRDTAEESREKLVAHIKEHGELESGQFKEILGTTRKYAIPILEYWDAQGLTRRVGNKRVLRENGVLE